MLRSALIAVALLVVVPASASASYWDVADSLQVRIDRYWDEGDGLYSGFSAGAHADVLLTLAVAAKEGHHGPARNDARARALVDALVSSPPFVSKAPPRYRDAQTHAPGWVSSMRRLRSNQHLVVDSEVVDGLRHAWIARRELGLSARQSAAIADRIHRTARSAFWRWPAIRLNQINWYALLYAADATVTGDPRMLRRDLRRQIERFASRARGSAGAAGNLGPGLHFNYLPHARAAARMNVDSAEYANIVASFAREYAQARRSGMRPVSAGARRLLKQWMMRVLAGYWTHGGYLNWDTGFGFRRWHQAKKLGLSQQALIGIASAPQLAPRPNAPAWARWMLDRSFEFYARQLERTDEPPGVFFGVHVVPQEAESSRLALARVASNAARAVAAGLESIPAKEPPSMYAFDADTGRLAVTTAYYNTAIVPRSRGAFPYGGIDIARLFDGRQEVAGGIGGRPPASFGLLVRDISGRRVFASQLPDRGRLRLTDAPHGVGARASAWTGRAYAGPFQDLRAAGVARGGGWVARTSHRFVSFFVHTTWTLVRTSRARGRVSADVLFPSWGRDATVTATLRDGSLVRVGARRLPLARVASLRIASRYTDYVVLPWRRPRGATIHLLRTAPQPSAPLAGPTLAVQLARRSRARSVRFSARFAPVTHERAASMAARLAE